MHEKRQRRNRRRKQLVAAGIILLLLIGAWSIFILSQRRQLRRIAGELEQDYRNAQFKDMQLKLENLQQYKTRFFQTAEVQSLARKLESALSEQGERARLASNFLLVLRRSVGRISAQ
jgi:predicted PurR-regulated permease PerM